MKYSIIGLGQAGSALAKGLIEHGDSVTVCCCGSNQDACQALGRAGAAIAADCQAAAAEANMVFSCVDAGRAEGIARQLAAILTPGQLFADFTFKTPQQAEQLEGLFPTGAYLDCAFFLSSTPTSFTTPIAVSGSQAEKAAKLLAGSGMTVDFTDACAGKAAAIALSTEIFTASVEAILVESLVSADAFQISKDIYESCVEFLLTDPKLALELGVTTNVMHSKRRADEVGDLADMLSSENLNNLMSGATASKLYWVDDCNLKEVFTKPGLPEMNDILDQLIKITVKPGCGKVVG